MAHDDLNRACDIMSLLEQFEIRGMARPSPARIGLRSGTSFQINGLRIVEPKDDAGVRVVAYQSRSTTQHDEVHFLASDVESVTRLGIEGVSPERADNVHTSKAVSMVDQVMSVEQELRMDRFRQLGAICTDTRPDWFTSIVRMQIERFDPGKVQSNGLDLQALEALLSDEEDDREVPAAVMLILVDFCYNALEHAYVPYIDDDDWTASAFEMIDSRLTDLGV